MFFQRFGLAKVGCLFCLILALAFFHCVLPRVAILRPPQNLSPGVSRAAPNSSLFHPAARSSAAPLGKPVWSNTIFVPEPPLHDLELHNRIDARNPSRPFARPARFAGSAQVRHVVP